MSRSHISQLLPTLDEIRANKDSSSFPPLSELQRAISALEAERDALLRTAEAKACDIDARIRKIKWITAPVRRIPVEILQQIFFAFCEDPLAVGDNHTDTIATSELLLSMVCSHWRCVALDTPGLWSTIKSRWDKRPSTTDPKICRLYLERSHPHPLTVFIKEDEIRYTSQVDTILRLLSEHSSRWYDVEIHTLDCMQLHERPFNTVRGNVPMLKRLVWEVPACFCPGTPPDPVDLFSDAPKLISVASFDDSIQTFPWSQLQHLSINRTSVTNILDNTSKCHSVAALCICDATFGLSALEGMMMMDDQEDSPITSSASSLRLTFNNTNKYMPTAAILNHWSRIFPLMLDRLTLPRLSSLTLDLESRDDSDSWSDTPFIALFNRSSSPLTHLCLKNIIPIEEAELIQFLRIIPSLTSFQIDQASVPSQDFDTKAKTWFTLNFVNQALTCPSRGSLITTQSGEVLDIRYALLPELKSIHFTFHAQQGNTIVDQLFTDMVSFRCKAEDADGKLVNIARVTSVRLNLYKKVISPVQHQALKAIAAETGATIVVYDGLR
jgi:hypothetical protein